MTLGLNDTPSADRVHIGFFGCRNAGKSSVVNAVTGQDLAVVSKTKGTTTDPVSKAMEILPLGPVVVIDTPGFDDAGDLGRLRVHKTRQVLGRTDLAVLVVDAAAGMKAADRELLRLFREKKIPHLTVFNKSDLLPPGFARIPGVLYVSAARNEGIRELREKLPPLLQNGGDEPRLIGDLLHPSDIVILVTPIDEAAPKGRLILPQQQAIRDVLDADAAAFVVKEDKVRETLENLKKKPALVITDSQAFSQVAAQTPREIPLTSFSILMARCKGFLESAVKGVAAVERLKDGDTVLMAEGCTHHRQCGDIGTVKLPGWLKRYTGKKLNIETSSGGGFPEDLSRYSLIIHCGGCMLRGREVKRRAECAAEQKIPMTNYGVTIAYLKGILKRSLGIFPDLLSELEK